MNKTTKRILALLLCLVMILALAACGKEKESEQPVEHPADAVKAEGYAYKAEYKPVETNAQWGLSAVAFTDDGFYATGYEKAGKQIPEGETEEYEGQYDIYNTVLYYVTWDGKATRLPEFEPGKAPENTGNYKDFSGSVYLSGVTLQDDGTLVGVEDTYCGWFDGPESTYGTEEQYNYYSYSEKYAIVTYDQNGKELSRAPVDYDTENSYLSFWRVVTDENGNILTTRDEGIVAFATDGSVAYVINSDNYINRLIRLKDGTLGALAYGDNGMEFYKVDTAAKQIGEGVPLPNDAWDVTTGAGGDYDLYYTSGLYLYGVTLGETRAEKLLNWIECDINGNSVSNESLYIREDGTIAGLLGEEDESGEGYSNQVFLLTKVPADTLPQKQELVLAEIYADPDLSNKIVKFNRAHDNVRILIKDYSEYNTEEDYSAGLTKLTTEIMAGNVPDLVDLNQLPYQQMAAKGLLEDLYPFIDADPTLDRGHFFTNVLKAMEVNGGLYEVTNGFSVETLVGAASVVGDTPGWTYDEYYAALASMPEGCTPMELWYTKESVLNNVLYPNLDTFVDWTTGKVNFECDEFRQLLEFVNTFPTDVNWDDETVTASTEERIQSGQQMLTSAYLYSLDSLLYNDMNFGGKSTYIGWPTSSGVGSCMQLGNAYGMSSNCADKEAAWEFLRTFLTEEGQSSTYNIPTNKKVFQKRLDEWMTPLYRKDADGNFVLDENGEKIQEPRGGWGSEDGEVHYIYSMTQEQADEVMNIIESCTKVSNYDTAIYDIVYEQAQAYFAGQKSIEEVMRLIQSKANIYVNEQR